MKKLVELKEGDIIAMPLFTANTPSVTTFKKEDLENKGKQFAFCRVISDQGGSGYIVEVFDLVGELNENLTSIIKSERLFEPVAISGLGIYKKRWRKIYNQSNYNKSIDSDYENIKLVLGAGDDLRLWQNGKETSVTSVEAKKYETWTIWQPSQLEKRIIENIFSEGWNFRFHVIPN